ncbi:MAG TPA: 3-methyl-2-oxobutanoate hydroxymethyltransferase [Thermomicrobiales bacterium]|nr:3-methyl-2-oxobutanoate hydroxymethyltransferase [Thermomicrobiales bacterium]
MDGRTKLTARDIVARKGGQKLTMLAAYDYPIARLIEAAGIELILVGDSLGMVVLGYDSPVPVTVDDVVYHSRAVIRGAPRTHVVADMPYLSYHRNDEQALTNAGRLIQEGGADAVKLEGGRTIAGRIRRLVEAGIPVMGHVGLTPQLAGGSFGVQGQDVASALAIVADAQAVAEAGAYAIVVEAIPSELGRIVTDAVPVPTIGIAAGPDCDGQTLVSTDLLGIESKLFLSFAKRYANLGPAIETAFASYVAEVRSGAFPGPEHSFAMPGETWEALRAALGGE